MTETNVVAVPTLAQVWDDYQKVRDLKPTTIKNYNQRLNHNLSDWLDQPIVHITDRMIDDKSSELRAKKLNQRF
jgi:hypothetical protein